MNYQSDVLEFRRYADQFDVPMTAKYILYFIYIEMKVLESDVVEVSTGKLATGIGRAKRTANRYVKLLRDAGAIKVDRKYDKLGIRLANSYRF